MQRACWHSQTCGSCFCKRNGSAVRVELLWVGLSQEGALLDYVGGAVAWFGGWFIVGLLLSGES